VLKQFDIPAIVPATLESAVDPEQPMRKEKMMSIGRLRA
jgi:hypothetical protein